MPPSPRSASRGVGPRRARPSRPSPRRSRRDARASVRRELLFLLAVVLSSCGDAGSRDSASRLAAGLSQAGAQLDADDARGALASLEALGAEIASDVDPALRRDALALRARALVEAGRFTEAASDAREALSLDASSVEIRELLARSLSLADQPEAAAREIEAALPFARGDSEEARLQYLLGSCLRRLGCEDAALRALARFELLEAKLARLADRERRAAVEPSTDSFLALGLELLANGQDASATRALRRAREIDGHRPVLGAALALAVARTTPEETFSLLESCGDAADPATRALATLAEIRAALARGDELAVTASRARLQDSLASLPPALREQLERIEP